MTDISSLESYWDNYFGLPAGFNEGLGAAESGNQNLSYGPGSSVGVFQETAGYQQQYGAVVPGYDAMNPSDQIMAADEQITQYPNLTTGLNAFHYGASSSQVNGPLYSAYSGIPVTGGAVGYTNNAAGELPSAAQNAAGDLGLPYTPAQPGGPLSGATASSASWWQQLVGDIENLAARGGLILIGVVLLFAAAFALSNGDVRKAVVGAALD